MAMFCDTLWVNGDKNIIYFSDCRCYQSNCIFESKIQFSYSQNYCGLRLCMVINDWCQALLFR